jgi:putative acetyltransferase
MVRIREEQPPDIKAIREVNIQTFGQTQEADIVDKLRQKCDELLSLVALKQNQVVGHILFSPAIVENEDKTVQEMGLAPMAVLPEHQRQRFGSKLIRAGVEKLKSWLCPFVIVLGHPAYYPRFGFEPANRYGIQSEWAVPDNAFMILVLNKSEMLNISGMTRYRREFAESL